MSEQTEFDVVIVGRGVRGHVHAAPRARPRACRRGCSRPATAWAARGTGTAIPARAATSRACSTRTSSPRSSSRNGSGSERYATQPEILDVREPRRRPVRPPPRHAVRDARAVGDLRRRRRPLDDHAPSGSPTATHEVLAQFLIMATGCLSSANVPDFPGRDTFAGDTYHTGQWPHEGVDFTGKRVGVIGTGSSAIQSIPIIAKQARTAHGVPAHRELLGPARNGPLDEEETRAIKADYAAFRARNSQSPTAIGSRLPLAESCRRSRSIPRSASSIYEQRWEHGGLPFLGAFFDLLIDKQANDTAAEFVRAKIHEHRAGPGGRRAALAEDGHRVQAPVRRHRLLRHVQPRPTSSSST